MASTQFSPSQQSETNSTKSARETK